MAEKDQKNESGEISRRQFLTGAGLVVAGGAIGAGIAYPLVPGKETIKEVEVPVEVPVEVLKYVCPYDGQEFDTLAALTDHMESAHPGEVETITKFVCPYDGQEFPTLAALTSHVNTAHPPEVVTVTEAVPGVVTLNVNGESQTVKVKPNWTLAYVIREKLGLTGTKIGCAEGDCGMCTLILDGRPVLSCLMLAIEADSKSILTVEGLAKGSSELHPIQQAFVENDAMMCGFCTPGQIMSAKALLDVNAKPTAGEVRKALAGVLCRCGAYPNIVNAVLAVAK